jgi:hypothetical protein
MPNAPATTRTKRSDSPSQSGLLITPRTTQILVSIYTMRQLSRDQLVRLHFPTLATSATWSSSVPGKVLRRLVAHDYLTARPMPVARLAGRPPLVYSIGPNAVPVLAKVLNLETEPLLHRLKLDAALSWMFYAHRHAIAEARIALTLACDGVGYGLIWYPDEELANLQEQTRVKGKPTAIRPDAFMVVDPGRQAPCFLEVQLVSEPRTYLKKAEAYEAYYASGAYTQRFGFQALRILAITDTAARAQHLHQVVSAAKQLTLPDIFWSTALTDFVASPFGPIWSVPGFRGRQSLIQD